MTQIVNNVTKKNKTSWFFRCLLKVCTIGTVSHIYILSGGGLFKTTCSGRVADSASRTSHSFGRAKGEKKL